MMSKILFLALIGCAVVLAIPGGVNKRRDFEVKEISEEEAKEIMGHIKEKLDAWYEKIKENVDDEELLKSFEKIKKAFDEIFNQEKLGNVNEAKRLLKRALLDVETTNEEEADSSETDQHIEVKEVTEEEAKEIIKKMKEKFEKIFGEVGKQIDEDFKKSFEGIKKFVEHIFEEQNNEN